MRKAIVTVPPYATFIDDVVSHPSVSGIRLNTVMPLKESVEEALDRLQDKAGDKDLYVDLKCRQLRVEGYGVPPFTEINISHEVSVDTPVTAYFNDGRESSKVLAVDGKRLIMEDGPKRVIGPGESINIPDKSLEIKGYLTELDKEYLEACSKLGINNIMLSYVEGKNDVIEAKEHHPYADYVLKIESSKGLDFVSEKFDGKERLMAARGDLFIEVERPHKIVKALENIISKDEDGIMASRIFPGLAYNPVPNCSDINDVDNMLRMGYKTFMFGDEICQHKRPVMIGLNLFYEMTREYNTKDVLEESTS